MWCLCIILIVAFIAAENPTAKVKDDKVSRGCADCIATGKQMKTRLINLLAIPLCTIFVCVIAVASLLCYLKSVMGRAISDMETAVIQVNIK